MDSHVLDFPSTAQHIPALPDDTQGHLVLVQEVYGQRDFAQDLAHGRLAWRSGKEQSPSSEKFVTLFLAHLVEFNPHCISRCIKWAQSIGLALHVRRQCPLKAEVVQHSQTHIRSFGHVCPWQKGNGIQSLGRIGGRRCVMR